MGGSKLSTGCLKDSPKVMEVREERRSTLESSDSLNWHPKVIWVRKGGRGGRLLEGKPGI